MILQLVGQTDFTNCSHFGAEVVFTDSSLRRAFERVVDATECTKRVAIVASVRGRSPDATQYRETRL
jgi:hypothetical protein